MTCRSITAGLGSLLVALLIAINAPAVGADPPCILDNAGNCATAPGVVVGSGGQVEEDQIRTALEMASAASTAPIAAALSGPASAPSEPMASAAWSK
jgi:hypothetical protein